MNPTTNFHNRLTTFKRSMVIFAVVLVLSSVFPAGKVEAAVSPMSYDTTTYCYNDSFQYLFKAAGQYYNQWIAYRFSVYSISLTTGSSVFLKSWPSSTGYYYAQAKRVSDLSLYGSVLATKWLPAPHNTQIQVRTTAYFWDNVNQRWIGPVTGAAEAHITMYYTLSGTSCYVS